MACTVTFNLGSDAKVEIKTIPMYRIKFEFHMMPFPSHSVDHGGSASFTHSLLWASYSYYINQCSTPIMSKRYGSAMLYHCTMYPGYVILMEIIKKIKNKESFENIGHGHAMSIGWNAEDNIWIDTCNLYGNVTSCNQLKLILNDDSIEQFIKEMKSFIRFMKLMEYKKKILNPSIINRI